MSAFYLQGPDLRTEEVLEALQDDVCGAADLARPPLVGGSHGRPDEGTDDGPLVISRRGDLFDGDRLASVDVHDLILRHLGLAAG